MSYLWILSSSPCLKCITLSAQIHLVKPTRPHPMCQCTFVQVKSDGGGKPCTDSMIEISSVTLTNVEVDYTSNDPDFSDNHLIHEYEVTGKCPDGTEIQVNLTIEISGQELAEQVAALYKEWDEGGTGKMASNNLEHITSERAVAKALEQMKTRCPACQPFKGV